jgi:phosphate starvation-inducible PhoH-like protein
MAKKRNLTKENIDDVSTYESVAQKNTATNNGTNLNDLQIKVRCLNEKQKLLKTSIEEKEITISLGPAGTGKTYLSLITALHLLKSNPIYQRLLLIKSLTTIKGEEVGYLPGTLWEKMEPYMYSFTGNLDKIFNSKVITKSLIEKGIIEIVPIAYIRGITIDNAIVIIDETQNMDFHIFRTIITRIGRNSKMIFLGDIEQIDRKDKKESCLLRVFRMFEDKDYVGTVEFDDKDCVRNPIIPKILDVLNDNKYNKDSNAC